MDEEEGKEEEKGSHGYAVITVWTYIETIKTASRKYTGN